MRATELRVQKVGALQPQPYTVLGWSVKSVDQVVGDITARGGKFERYKSLQQDDAGIWTSPSGAKVAWLKDADGNLLSLTERPSS